MSDIYPHDDDYENPIGEYPDLPADVFPPQQRIYNKLKSLFFKLKP